MKRENPSKNIKPERVIKKRIFFDETSTYILASGFILTLILYYDSIFVDFLDIAINDFRFLILFVLGLVGSIIALNHALKKGRKSEGDLMFMLWFVLLYNGFFGIYSGLTMLVKSEGIQLIFPIINIVSAFYLLFATKFGKIGIENFSQRDSTKSEIIISSALVVLGILVSKYVIKNPWYLTISAIAAISSIFFNMLRAWRENKNEH